MVGNGIGQKLSSQSRPTRVARADRTRRCQIAPGAFPHHQQRPWPCVRRPFQRGIGIIQWLRKGVFGCKPIIDTDDFALGRTGHAAAGRVGQIQVTDHPAPAMKVDARPQKLPRRNVAADGNRPVGPGNHRIDDARQFGQTHGRRRCGHRRAHHGPALIGRDLVVPRPACGGISVKDCLIICVHGPALPVLVLLDQPAQLEIGQLFGSITDLRHQGVGMLTHAW